MGKKNEPMLPNRLRHWRNFRGMTLAQVAAKMGTGVATVGRHETQVNEVTLNQLVKYSLIYNVSVPDLLPDRMRDEPTMAALIEAGHKLSPELRLQLVQIAGALGTKPVIAKR